MVLRMQTIAMLLRTISLSIIVVEAYFFARRALGPLNSLLFQTAKFIIVGGQCAIILVSGEVARGKKLTLQAWIMIIAQGLLVAEFA